MIALTLSTVDGVLKTRRFKSVTGARSFAVRALGETPEIGRSYAVSGDGVAKISARGISLEALFGGEGERKAVTEVAAVLEEGAPRFAVLRTSPLYCGLTDANIGSRTALEREVASIDQAATEAEALNVRETEWGGDDYYTIATWGVTRWNEPGWVKIAPPFVAPETAFDADEMPF